MLVFLFVFLPDLIFMDCDAPIRTGEENLRLKNGYFFIAFEINLIKPWVSCFPRGLMTKNQEVIAATIILCSNEILEE